jgi:biotin carboxylase
MQEAVRFFEQIDRPVVIKPLTGSGSELVFLCESVVDCMRAFRTLSIRLADHCNARMYAPVKLGEEIINPRNTFVIEEHIRGREFSCDFILDEGHVEIIRIARKIQAKEKPLGTIQAYVLPSVLAGKIDTGRFREQLLNASTALGLTRTIAMVDFIIRGQTAYLLELTPRPGGDCLPDMMRHSSGFDIIGASLDFAEGKSVTVPPPDAWRRIVGTRLFASRDGILRDIDTAEVKRDRRVLAVLLKRQPNDVIILPPDDYESWLLGTVIFKPSRPWDIEYDIRELTQKIAIDIETPIWNRIRAS